MKFLLPSIRYLVPVVAFLLLGQVGWAQGGSGGSCGFSRNNPVSGVTTVAAPNTVTNDIIFWNRYSDGATDLNGCTGCDGSYGVGSGLNTTPYSYPDYSDGVAPFYEVAANYSGGTPFATPAGAATTAGTMNGDLPIEHLPATLPFGGGTMVEYFDVDFEFDPQNCTVEVLLDNTFWDNSSGDCQFVNYYDKFGEFLGREDLRIGSVVSGGAVFSLSDHPVPFVLDDRNINGSLAGTKGYPTVGDFVFMQIDNGSACDAADYDAANHIFGATRRSVVKAFRIRSVSDVAGPIIKGTFDIDDDYCNPDNFIFDNNPTNIVGDPRTLNNDTEMTLTDNDPTVGTGGDNLFEDAAVANPANDQVRALLCRELLAEGNDNGGVLPGDMLPDPKKFVYVFDYGTTDQVGEFSDPITGTGCIDGTDPSNEMNGDFYNQTYAANTMVTEDLDDDVATGENNFQPFAPDACGGAITTDYSDAVDYSDRGNIYGLISDNLSGTDTEDVSDGVEIPMILGAAAITFGDGGDGRFRECYSITRKWTATDERDNSSMCDQKISVIDDYEGSTCMGTAGEPQVSQAGSPFFLTAAPISGSDSITVFPQYFQKLDCNSGNTNIYHNTNTLTPAGGSGTQPIPTLYKYQNPAGALFPDVVAPSVAITAGGQSNVATGSTTNGEHYNFPVFTYSDAPTTYTCAQEATLDGFMPTAVDSCGLRPLIEIRSLYDRGLDGDFGDEGQNMGISTSVPYPFYDKDEGRYYNNHPNVNIAGEATATGYVQYDDRANGYAPNSCEFYNYDILKRWVSEDNCGMKSIAQRVYRIRDIEAPDAPMGSIMVNSANQTLTLMSNTLTSSTPGDTINTKTFVANSTVNIPFTGCTPQATITTTYDDNCANILYLNTTYDIEIVSGSTTTPLISGIPYTGTFTTSAGLLTAGVNYKFILNVNDPCSNITKIEIPVTTAPNGMIGCPDADAVNLTLTAGGTTQLNSLLIMPTSSCIKLALINGCNIPECVYLEMIVNGSVVDVGTILETETDGDINIIDFLDQIPTYIFNCMTGTFPVTVNLYEVSPCVVASDENTAFDPSTQTRNLLITHTRDVVVSASTAGGVTATASGVDASSGIATDGQINLNISSSFPGETYTITYTQVNPATLAPIGTTIVAATAATGSTFSISGLPAAMYQVNVTGSTSCGSNTPIYQRIGISTPLQLQYTCPSSVTAGQPYIIGIAPTGSFSNLSGISFGVEVTGTAGAIIQTVTLAPGFSPSVPSTFAFSTTEWNVVWADNSGTGTSITSMIDFVNIEVLVPASAPVGSTISVEIKDLFGGSGTTIPGTASATQAPSNTSVSLLLPSSPCGFNVTTPSTGNLSISGNINYMGTGVGVSGTTVNLTNVGGSPGSSVTGSTPSSYSFTGITMGDNITICPTKTSDERGSVDIMDLIDLSVYVSNPTFASSHGMTNPYQLIAGDVNQDGVVDLFDLTMLNRYLLFDPAVTLDNWVFVLASQGLPVPTTTNVIPTLDTCYSTTNYLSSLTENFVGVKVGDVDQDVNVILLPDGTRVETRGMESFVLDDQAIKAGEEVTITFKAKDFETVRGYFAHLYFDPSYLSFLDLDLESALPEMKEHNFGLSEVNKGNIFTLWGGQEAIDLDNGATLFSLRFKALKSANSLKGIFTTRSNRANTELYSANGVADLRLEFASTKKDFRLYPTSPNPFSERTKVSFDLPEASQVNMVVTDLTGKVVYSTQANMDAGYNEIWLSKADLLVGGVYFYQIQAANYQASSKMILID